MRDWLYAISVAALVSLNAIAPAEAGEKLPESPSPTSDDPPFYLIRPGTPILEGAPASWSHLVVKAQTRLASGDINSVPAWGARMATRIRTVILADVGHLPDDPT